MKKLLLLFFTVSFLNSGAIYAQSDWISLFNGKDLTGWFIRGKATWAVQNGVLVGEGGMGHIYTYTTASDFEFKGMFRITGKKTNSGFYFRAVPPENNPDGFPRGYEAQICHNQDAHTGWLWKPGTPTGEAEKLITKDGEWFSYKIKAVGNNITFWINGELVMKYEDDEYQSGYFAIQGHNPGMKIEAKELYYKNLKKDNILSKQEKESGWELLFNGKNFNGWRQYDGTKMPENWVIEDETMKVHLGKGKKPGQGANGDIIFGDKKFKNFELSIDWKAGEMANSGIFYNIRETPGKKIYYAAPEIQVLDNENATDNKIDSHLAGSLYDMIAADPGTVNPAGFWNTVVIKVQDGKVSHTMNGRKVVEYTLWTKEWDELVQNSKFKNFPGFIEGVSKEGYIGLQDHGYTVWFKNLKIREL